MPDRAQEPAELTPVFYDWSLAFEHEATRKGLAYWNEQRGAQSVPAFKDIRPKGMKDFIANVSLIERGIRADGAAEYSVRLTGERVRERYGAVARRKLQEFLPAEMERRWRHALELVRTAQVPVRVHGRMSYADSAWLYQETLLAPLRDASDQVSMFLLVTAWWPTKI
jgi:hypothetical protein